MVKRAGYVRVGLSVFRGVGLQGGHIETKGLSGTGEVVAVPAHRHRVLLNFTRAELYAEYAVTDSWAAFAYMPYEIKAQGVSVPTIASATPEERAAQLRNVRIHHRDETYRGLADIRLLLGRRFYSVVRKGDALTLRFGPTVPIGKTENNPYLAAAASKAHQHIQFGSGTIDPLAEASFFLPLVWNLALNAELLGKWGVYRNTKGFRRAPELIQRLSLVYEPITWLALSGGLVGIAQGQASWKKTGRDINTGIFAVTYALGAYITLGHWSVGFSAGDLLYQTIFDKNGDAWKQNLSITANIAWQQQPK